MAKSCGLGICNTKQNHNCRQLFTKYSCIIFSAIGKLLQFQGYSSGNMSAIFYIHTIVFPVMFILNICLFQPIESMPLLPPHTFFNIDLQNLEFSTKLLFWYLLKNVVDCNSNSNKQNF